MKYPLKTWVIFCYLVTSSFIQSVSYQAKMLINVAVADLRSEPKAVSPNVVIPTSDLTNPLQETQLLLAEHIVVHQEFWDQHTTKWLKVSALQQDHYTLSSEWHTYPGWILADQAIAVNAYPENNLVVKNLLADLIDQNGRRIQTISIGTRLCATKQKKSSLWRVQLPDNTHAYIHHSDVYEINPIVQESSTTLRRNIIATAMKFLDSFYSWGGRSAQNDDWPISSVDCSALVNLSFLAHGLQIPRMSHSQYLTCHKIFKGNDLQQGDLVFFSSVKKDKQPIHIVHVMIYIGDENLLETTFADSHTARIIPFKTRIGTSRNSTHTGDITNIMINGHLDDEQYYIYFGSYFNDPATVQHLRDNALKHEY